MEIHINQNNSDSSVVPATACATASTSEKMNQAIEKIIDVLKALKDDVNPTVEEDAPDSIFSRGYWNYRFKKSHLFNPHKSDFSADDIDSSVGTIALINALILTIPFALMGSLDHNFWDWMEEIFTKCPDSLVAQTYTLEQIYQAVYDQMLVSLYTPMSTLLLTLFYFFLRPKREAQFARWWPRGRYVISAMLVGTIVSVVGALTIAGTLVTGFWQFSPTSWRCATPEDDHDTIRRFVRALSLGVFFVIFPSVAAIILMF